MTSNKPAPRHWSGGFSMFVPWYDTETKKYVKGKCGYIPTLKELALNALLAKMPQDLIEASPNIHFSNYSYHDMVKYKNEALADFQAKHTDVLPSDIVEWVGRVGFWRFEKCMKLIFLENAVYEEWHRNTEEAYGKRNHPLYIKDHGSSSK